MEFNDGFMSDAAQLIQMAFKHHHWLKHRPPWTKARSRDYRHRQLSHMFGLAMSCHHFAKKRGQTRLPLTEAIYNSELEVVFFKFARAMLCSLFF